VASAAPFFAGWGKNMADLYYCMFFFFGGMSALCLFWGL
jgi:hypothetical protein